MAKRLITQEEVTNACNELVKAGEQPSTLKLHKMLGRGSYGTIQKLIATWKESDDAKDAQVAQLPAVVELPSQFTEDGQILLKKIYHLAEQEHAAKVEKIRTECDSITAKAALDVEEAVNYANEISEEKEEIESKNQELLLQVKQLETQLQQALANIDNCKAEREKSEIALAKSNDKVSSQSNQITVLEKELSITEKNLTAAQADIVKNNDTHNKNIESVRNQHNADIKTLKSEHTQAVKDLKSANDSAVKNLTKAHDTAITELKAANSKTISTLESQVKDLKASVTKLETELKTVKTQDKH